MTEGIPMHQQQPEDLQAVTASLSPFSGGNVACHTAHISPATAFREVLL